MKALKLLVCLFMLSAAAGGISNNANAQFFPDPYHKSGTTLPGLHQGMSGIINMRMLYGSDRDDQSKEKSESDDAKRDEKKAGLSLFAKCLVGFVIALLAIVALFFFGLAVAIAVEQRRKDKENTQG